jgi:hypothetical protein
MWWAAYACGGLHAACGHAGTVAYVYHSSLRICRSACSRLSSSKLARLPCHMYIVFGLATLYVVVILYRQVHAHDIRYIRIVRTDALLPAETNYE